MMKLHAHVMYIVRRCMYDTRLGWRICNALERRRGMREHATSAYWNDELAGRMSRPNTNARIGQSMRDLTTVALMTEFAPHAESVLDVGCGLGTLAHAVITQGTRRYVGIDLSDYVIARLRGESREWAVAQLCNVRFEQANLCTYKLANDERFDVIVFNEVLKYLSVAEAVKQARRYAEWLNPGGVLVVNISVDPKCRAIVRAIADELNWVYGTLYQARPQGPEFRITMNRETPGFITAAYQMHRQADAKPTLRLAA